MLSIATSDLPPNPERELTQKTLNRVMSTKLKLRTKLNMCVCAVDYLDWSVPSGHHPLVDPGADHLQRGHSVCAVLCAPPQPHRGSLVCQRRQLTAVVDLRQGMGLGFRVPHVASTRTSLALIMLPAVSNRSG